MSPVNHIVIGAGVTEYNRPRLEVLEDVGYEFKEDTKQAGRWFWCTPTDGSEDAFESKDLAVKYAWSDAVGQTMGINNYSSEHWDSLSFEQQKVSIKETLRPDADDGDDDAVQGVVDDVQQRAEKYGFKPEESTVRWIVAESADLLSITLSEEQIASACDRVMHPDDAPKDQPRE